MLRNVNDIPPAFAERMTTLLGPEAHAFLRSLQEPARTGLRVNTLKLSPETLRTLIPWGLEPIPWCPTGFLVPDELQSGKHPFHDAGLYYLQEPSAMAVAEALAPQPGERVLDLAAAPGGKSTHLVSLVQDTGLVVANEINAGRTRALTSNLERWGARNAVITNDEVGRLAKRWGATFDRVLLDAPCSGEGMFRKSSEALSMWSEKNVLGCAKRQDRLLQEASALVRPGGSLVYSTCTFAPEEDEGIIAAFLKDNPDFELRHLDLPGAEPGRPEWLPHELNRPDLTRTVRMWPHLIPGEGHFIACLGRTDGPPAPPTEAAFKLAPKAARDLWRDFRKETLGQDPVLDAFLTVAGDRLYAVPPHTPDLHGVKLARAGVWLGTILKNRLEPSHSLALTLRPDDIEKAPHRLDLSPEDERLVQYLQGHPLDDPGEDGWVLMVVSGYALGWGRRARGIVKNAYPKGLRRQG
jgi:NOL1/NOP2/sun family putative RNA methylase